ncbi:hypothetical protein [Leptospira bandrabouensis]|uniref:hypothetical protein n=1 Tax=Leptospira bandrabouensis TaxID=2484903 RepID=UPI001EE7DA65|nr:hypothetical protein [Leptospira bandrabouensis]MCG6146485.1 hypothetical protein [Leptospira bandrabouensis]MCG6161857.1 hypothetical protein [Leptospira bandrabouensis]MCG6166092.1 hypothetical protein [Leptospira bandrabouensis]
MKRYFIGILLFLLCCEPIKSFENEIIKNGRIISCKCIQEKEPGLGWTAGFNPDLAFRLSCKIRFLNKSKEKFIGLAGKVKILTENRFELSNLDVRSEFDNYRYNDIIELIGFTSRQPRFKKAECIIEKVFYEDT